MVKFLENNSLRKSWLLPDGQHKYSSNIYGNFEYWTVEDTFTGKVRQSGTLKLDAPNWEELSFLVQELAAKRYKSKNDRSVAEYKHSYRK